MTYEPPRPRRRGELVEPRDAEERAMRLLGLGWAGAPGDEIERARDAVLAEQNADGGWAQLPSRSSDSYATGQALVALWQLGGVSPSSSPYRRGIEFLMRQQEADGSWHVATRRRSEVLPHFETGFRTTDGGADPDPASLLAEAKRALRVNR